jgi:hypothetical protein
LREAILFGIAIGLATSAKYVGAILLPVALLPPLWAGTDPRRYYQAVIAAGTVALLVFCAVNFPLFTNPLLFARGLKSEINHALRGDLIVLYGWQANFLFIWTANLWPGLQPPLALAGLFGTLIVGTNWRESPPVLRQLLIFGLAWYLLHELSPMKPYPEGARHMTVMAGVFAVFAAYVAEWTSTRFSSARGVRSGLAASMIFLVSLVPAYASYRLVRSASDDTQLVVKRILTTLDGPSVWAWPATSEPLRELSEGWQTLLREPGFIVVHEPSAKRYVKSLALRGQTNIIRERARAHQALLERPALRVTSKAGSFAFRNVPHRIIVLGADPRLLMEAKQTKIPSSIILEFVPGGDSGRRGRAEP